MTPEAKKRYNANRSAKEALDIEFYRERNRSYRAKDPDRYRALAKKSYRASRLNTPWKSMLWAAQSRAKKKGIAFSLTLEWAEATWTGRCAITDLPLSIGKIGLGPGRCSPSIDRIDARLGYTPENCRIIMFAVNAMRQDGTDEEMVEVAKAIIRKYSMG